MATHSSVLAWRIPGTGEPGELPSMGSHRVGHDWSDLAAAACSLHPLTFKVCMCVHPSWVVYRIIFSLSIFIFFTDKFSPFTFTVVIVLRPVRKRTLLSSPLKSLSWREILCSRKRTLLSSPLRVSVGVRFCVHVRERFYRALLESQLVWDSVFT